VRPAPLHKLGDTLRQARERKGLDLAAVERDTRIRARYLSALERGDYRDLPGAVYTRGFLRNYGQYLGLDPEYLLDLYRLEADGLEPAAPRPLPQPIVARLHKGAKTSLTRRPVNGVWLPAETRFNGTGRAMMFRRATINYVREYFDYRPYDPADPPPIPGLGGPGGR
jgi:transcriptional regulator with XRE-family HTH domain